MPSRSPAPRRSPRADASRRRKLDDLEPIVIPTTITTTSATTTRESASVPLQHTPPLRDLAALAVKLQVGQSCEGGCGEGAVWAAVAPNHTRFGCRQHIGGLLDTTYIWFLHPMDG